MKRNPWAVAVILGCAGLQMGLRLAVFLRLLRPAIQPKRQLLPGKKRNRQRAPVHAVRRAETVADLKAGPVKQISGQLAGANYKREAVRQWQSLLYAA